MRHKEKKVKPLISNKERIKLAQKVYDIAPIMNPEDTPLRFEDTISIIFGPFKIGKSEFAMELGKVLQRKYCLPLPATYSMQFEVRNHRWLLRGSEEYIRTWPTFRKFVDYCENHPDFVSTVKMWIIDKIDGADKQCWDTTCFDLGVTDLKEASVKLGDRGWSAVGYSSHRGELLHQILRLRSLGPGVLILSGERMREYETSRTVVHRASTNLSDKTYSTIAEVCSMILRMRYLPAKKGEVRLQRCLSAFGSEKEDVGDNLNVVAPHYRNGIISFTEASEAVEKLLACFDSKIPLRKHKKVKKVRKAKRSVRR